MDLRLADNIAQELEELIFDGTFSDGDRLDEVKLAEQFGVSRTPLREAFQRLALSGLVDLIPRRGAFVRQPGPVELMEMFEVMAELEALCARLAARRITPEQRAALARSHETCVALAETGDPEAYYEENRRFHEVIYAASQNAYLQDSTRSLRNRLQPYRRFQLNHPGRIDRSLAEHGEVEDGKVVAVEHHRPGVAVGQRPPRERGVQRTGHAVGDAESGEGQRHVVRRGRDPHRRRRGGAP